MQDSPNSSISQRNIVQQHADTASHLFPLINNLTMKFVALVTLPSVVIFRHRHPTIKLAAAHHSLKWNDN